MTHACIRRPMWRVGVTLAELVVSLGVLGVLMLGLGSAVLVASHALPVDRRIETGGYASAEVADLIVEELRVAARIVEHSANSLTLALPDRDGDGLPEQARYLWLGAGGDALVRQFKGGGGVALVPLAESVDFDLTLAAETEIYPGPLQPSEEMHLSVYDALEDDWDCTISPDRWAGQYCKPTLPDDAVGWTPLNFFVAMRRKNDADSAGRFQVRTATEDGTPTDVVLAELAVDESDLRADYAWILLTLDDVGVISPDDGLCAVMVQTEDEGECAEWLGDEDAGAGAVTTRDGGASWTSYDDRAFMHVFTGYYFTAGPEQTATRYFATQGRVSIQPDSDQTSHVAAAGRLFNRPELLSGEWVADFSDDPSRDLNADGAADWVRRDGVAFDEGSLVGGAWQADATLDTNPPHDFHGLTTAELRFRATSVGAPGATFWINADWSGGECAAISAQLALQPDGTQTLRVYHKLSDSQREALLTMSNLSADFVTLRLLIDPALDTVNVRVNDEDRGTFAYATFAPSSEDRFASVLPWGASAEFDYVSIKVSE